MTVKNKRAPGPPPLNPTSGEAYAKYRPEVIACIANTEQGYQSNICTMQKIGFSSRAMSFLWNMILKHFSIPGLPLTII